MRAAQSENTLGIGLFGRYAGDSVDGFAAKFLSDRCCGVALNGEDLSGMGKVEITVQFGTGSEAILKAILRSCIFLAVLGISVWSQELTAIRIVGMDYPPLAIAAGVKGSLKIRCNLSSDGKVLFAEILDASSRPVRDILGKAVQDNVLQWIFRVNENVPAPTVLTYTFELLVKPNPAKGSKFVFDGPASVKVIAEVSDQVLP